ncbi:hypothetical protein TWF696_005572 [Orbilia brochopaga]|uniref:Uncharacterized protein n=1 Tax=Orbilia brochopaga TaxID=3140254 RepID=A0AAV9V1X9_9PEZI
MLASYDTAGAIDSNPMDRRRLETDIEQHAARICSFIKEYHGLSEKDAQGKARLGFIKIQVEYSIENITTRSRQFMKDFRAVRDLDIPNCTLFSSEPTEARSPFFVKPPDIAAGTSEDEYLATWLPQKYLEVEGRDDHGDVKAFFGTHPKLPTGNLKEADFVLWHILFLWLFETLDRLAKPASRSKQIGDNAAVAATTSNILVFLHRVRFATHSSFIFRRWVSIVSKIGNQDEAPRLPPGTTIFTSASLKELLKVISHQEVKEHQTKDISEERTEDAAEGRSEDKATGPPKGPDAFAPGPSQGGPSRGEGGQMKKPGKAKTIARKIWSTIRGKERKGKRQAKGNAFSPDPDQIAAAPATAPTAYSQDSQRSGSPVIPQGPQSVERHQAIGGQSTRVKTYPRGQYSRNASKESGPTTLESLDSNLDDDDAFHDIDIGVYDTMIGQEEKPGLETKNLLFRKAHRLTDHLDTVLWVTQSNGLAKLIAKRGFSLTVLPHDTKPIECPAENLESMLAYFLAPGSHVEAEETPARVQEFLNDLPNLVPRRDQLNRLLSLRTDDARISTPRHAELLLLEYILAGARNPVYDYMGISKPPCFSCEAVLLRYQDRVQTRNGHGHVYVSEIPEGIPARDRRYVFDLINGLAGRVAFDMFVGQRKKRSGNSTSSHILSGLMMSSSDVAKVES